MFDIWTNVCFLFNSSVEINDDSKVKLKTIICLQRNMENEGRIVVYRKLNAFFKKQNACFIKHCYFQSTHFRFIKQNIHLIHICVPRVQRPHILRCYFFTNHMRASLQKIQLNWVLDWISSYSHSHYSLQLNCTLFMLRFHLMFVFHSTASRLRFHFN